MTTYHYNRRLAQPAAPLVALLLLVAAMLVLFALSMSAVRRSAGDWPAGPLPTPEPAPDMAPTVALPPFHVG
jgi:hypothetical protein